MVINDTPAYVTNYHEHVSRKPCLGDSRIATLSGLGGRGQHEAPACRSPAHYLVASGFQGVRTEPNQCGSQEATEGSVTFLRIE